MCVCGKVLYVKFVCMKLCGKVLYVKFVCVCVKLLYVKFCVCVKLLYVKDKVACVREVAGGGGGWRRQLWGIKACDM